MWRRNRTGSLLVGLVATLAALLVMTGCDSKSTSGKQDESGTQIDIAASQTTLNVGATSVVEATVTTDGTATPNEVVTFTVTPSGAGYFTPASDTTDATGVAATVFTATMAASATLQASVGGTVSPATLNVTVSQAQQSGSGNVGISVSRGLLLANGSDTSLVTVIVRDQLGQLAADSTIVALAAGERFVDKDGNGFWSEGMDSLVYDANSNGAWDAIGFIPSTARVTGGEGSVTVTYISGNDAGTVYVKATVNNNGITGSAEAPIQLSPNTEIYSLFLISDSMHLSVKGTGGIETGLLHAIGYDVNGNPVPEGIPVNFVILDGPEGGEHLGTVAMGEGPYATVTNGQGVATATISSGTRSGTVRIRAQASDTVLSNATQVLISSGPPVYIVVGSEKCNVAYWDRVAEEVKVTAVVSDVYLNPVNDSTVVYFTTDEGTMKSHEERTKEHEGIAYSVWFSGNNVDQVPNDSPDDVGAGRVLVIVETAGGTVVDTSMFFNSFYADSLTIYGNPATMPADGETQATIFVEAVDVNNNPVVNGTPFDAEARYIKTQGGTFSDGCYSSVGRVKITAPTLKADFSMTGGNDNGIGAIDVVQYWTGSFAGASFAVTLLTANAYTPNCTINGSASAQPAEAVFYNVVIKDRYGNPLGDHTVIMTASGGTVSGGTQKTNAYGEAMGFTWTAPGVAGTYTLSVTDTDPRGGVILTKTVTVED